MVTPRILQQQLLDLIRTSIDGDREVPSDDAIAARFNLRGIEAARSLLASRKSARSSRAVAPPSRQTPSAPRRANRSQFRRRHRRARSLVMWLAKGRSRVPPWPVLLRPTLSSAWKCHGGL